MGIPEIETGWKVPYMENFQGTHVCKHSLQVNGKYSQGLIVIVINDLGKFEG